MGTRTQRRVLAAFACAVVGLGCLALVLSRLDTPADSSVPEPRTISTRGVSLLVPPGWNGQILEGGEPDRLPALEARKARVRLTVLEVGNRPGVGRFRATTLPVTLDVRHVTDSFPGIPRTHRVARRLFAVNGRSFSARAEFRKDALSSALKETNEVLRTLRVLAPPGTNAATRARLMRPLHLPRALEGRCLPSSTGRRAPYAGVTLGAGPAFPVLSGTDGIARLRDDLVKRGWYLHKTLWAISPRYRGPLVVRGARIDAKGSVLFDTPLRRILRWPGLYAEQSGWRYTPSTTALRGPGCYALQIDGTTFSRVVVFEAQI
jgi:hypothetical protein